MAGSCAFISVGSNIEPEKNVRAAVHELARRFEKVKISTVYRTSAVDRPEQPAFYNCIVEVETDIAPRDIKFQVLRPIEAALGRQRTSDKYAPRTIDLDLIIYGDVVLDTDGLVLPDPEITRRSFLAIPLAELRPDLILPGTATCFSEIAAAWPKDAIQPLHSYTASLRRDIQ